MSGAPVPNRGGLGNKGFALDWQMGDRSIICDNEASRYMSYPSNGMIINREAKTSMKTGSGMKHPIQV